MEYAALHVRRDERGKDCALDVLRARVSTKPALPMSGDQTRSYSECTSRLELHTGSNERIVVAHLADRPGHTLQGRKRFVVQDFYAALPSGMLHEVAMLKGPHRSLGGSDTDPDDLR